MQKLKSRTPSDVGALQAFQRLMSAVSNITDQVCSLKPEVSLLVELYGAERDGIKLSVSSVGLVSGIPQTTTLRYLRYLEQRGWIICSQHETDKRVTHIRLAPSIAASFDKVFGQ